MSVDSTRLMAAFNHVFGRRIDVRGLRRHEVVERSELPATLIQGFLHNDYGPTLVDFVKIAEGLQISPVILMRDVIEEYQPTPERPAAGEDPISRLVPALGSILRKRVPETDFDIFASAIELNTESVWLLSNGYLTPSLPGFFRIARALRTEPTMLLVDLIKEWRHDRHDPTNDRRPRADDFHMLFRLGYYDAPREFREHLTAYDSVGIATNAASVINAQRLARGAPLLDTVTIYVRVNSLRLRTDTNWVSPTE